MAVPMHQGSCPQKTYSIISIRRKAWRGPGRCREHQFLAFATVSAGPRASLSGRIDCRFARSSRFTPVLQKRLICINSSPLNDLSSAAATLEWEPAVDNLLLVLSIALAYIAGIITPSSSSPLRLRRKMQGLSTEICEEAQTLQTAADEEGSSLEEEDLWNSARLKLSNSIDGANDLEDHMCDDTTQQLSLQALARGPRLRLLLTTLEQLNKEVWNWQQNKSFLRADWSGFFMQRLCEVIIPICQLWMCGEHAQNSKDLFSFKRGCILPESVDKNISKKWNLLFDSYSQTYGGYKSTKATLLATGKAEFYADFMYTLCSGTVRENGYCRADNSRGDKTMVLEDLIIFVADRASALYLDLISTGSTICDNQWFDILSQSISSTRLLEKFRNEVALNSWLHDNFESVTAMFEDRFNLWILKSSSSSKSKKTYQAKLQSDRWRDQGKDPVVLVIGQHRMFARRARELRALTGWRYYFSLFLEFSDICGPLLRTAVTKLGEGISFLLVTLIGRSLGLIYRGICQSIQWKSG